MSSLNGSSNPLKDELGDLDPVDRIKLQLFADDPKTAIADKLVS
jgi:hypothetical protein